MWLLLLFVGLEGEVSSVVNSCSCKLLCFTECVLRMLMSHFDVHDGFLVSRRQDIFPCNNLCIAWMSFVICAVVQTPVQSYEVLLLSCHQWKLCNYLDTSDISFNALWFDVTLRFSLFGGRLNNLNAWHTTWFKET